MKYTVLVVLASGEKLAVAHNFQGILIDFVEKRELNIMRSGERFIGFKVPTHSSCLYGIENTDGQVEIWEYRSSTADILFHHHRKLLRTYMTVEERLFIETDVPVNTANISSFFEWS